MPERDRLWDVVIVGAGPAGVSAALVLGRCCRAVLVCDAGEPRNWAAAEMHGFLSRDRIDPDEFRRLARGDLAHYPNVELREARVQAARRLRDGTFRVRFAAGGGARSRQLLIATGPADELPDVARAADLYRPGAYPRPPRRGFQPRAAPLAAHGRGARASRR